MRKQYSLGVFLDLLNNNISEWKDKIAFIDSLPGVEHVEIWVEALPLTSYQTVFLNRKLKRYRRLIHAPFVGVDFLSPNLPIRQAAFDIFNQTTELGKRLKAEHITWHLGRIPWFMDPKTAVSLMSAEVVKQLRTSLPFTQSLENLPLMTGAAVTSNFGKYLHENWLLKKQIEDSISNPQIDEYYETGIKNGALGGKLLGAGGRGYIMFYAPKSRHASIINALSSLEYMHIKLDHEGSKIFNLDIQK